MPHLPSSGGPINLVNFTHSVSDGSDGINLFASAEETFFTIQQDELIKQLWMNDMPPQVRVIEELDEGVKRLVLESNREAIIDFITAYTKKYKGYNKGYVVEHVEESYPRYLAVAFRATLTVALALLGLFN